MIQYTSDVTSKNAGLGNLHRLSLMRWIAIAGQITAIAAGKVWLDIHLPLVPMLFIVALLIAFNLITWVRLNRPAAVNDAELFMQLSVDLTALTVLLFFSGGASNPFVSLYLPPIAIAAAILPARFAWAVAAISGAAYSMLVFISMPLLMDNMDRAPQLHLVGMWLTFVISAALITWFVARMTSAIRQRDLALAAAREEALRNERVVALGSLAAGAAHELGTPLSTMAVIVGELLLQPKLDQTDLLLQEDLILIREQITHCKSIITGLVDQAGEIRAEGGRAISINDWLTQVVARWQQLRPHAHCTVSLSGTSPAPHIVGEATLEQALLNLFNNAADASSGSLDAPNQVDIAGTWDQKNLRVEVRDRGPGLVADVLRNAGQTIFKTATDQGQRPASNGAGIGLLLAHAAVERFGGHIVLENRVDGGALIRAEIPLEKILAVTAKP